MAAPKKRFSRKTDHEPAPTVEFSVDFDHDGEIREHHFTAHPKITYGDMVGLKTHQKDTQGGVLPYLDRIIRRSLDDTDGVPLKWEPDIAAGEFTTPDGNQAPLADLPKYQDFDAGSSRRRWAELIESDDAVVDFEQVMGVFEYLAEAVADRPTSRPQRS